MIKNNILSLLSSTPSSVGVYALMTLPSQTSVSLRRVRLTDGASNSLQITMFNNIKQALNSAEHETKLSDFASHDSSSTVWSEKVASENAVGAVKGLFKTSLSGSLAELQLKEDELKRIQGLLLDIAYVSKAEEKQEINYIRAYFQYYGGAVLTREKFLLFKNTGSLKKPNNPIFRIPTSCILVCYKDDFIVLDLKKYESRFGFDNALETRMHDALGLLRTKEIFPDTKPFVDLVKNRRAFRNRIITAVELIDEFELDTLKLIAAYDPTDTSQKGLLKLDKNSTPSKLLLETQTDAQNFCDFCNADLGINRLSQDMFRILSKKKLEQD